MEREKALRRHTSAFKGTSLEVAHHSCSDGTGQQTRFSHPEEDETGFWQTAKSVTQ